MTVSRGGSDQNNVRDSSSTEEESFQILKETIAYSRWRTILQRKVQMRNGKIVDFDLVGVKTGEGAVLIFAWSTHTKTATLIREYMPASHKVMWGLAAGLIEDKHGHDTEMAARHELEEECHLKGGKWILLTKSPVAMDKYSTTKMHCYLVIDPEPEENPKPLDDEEDIEIVSGVTIPEILGWITNGEMNLVGGWGALLAIEKLRELGQYQ
jgi:ADP-ribose pyrophosphatase YjhB (NUDIX family)